MGKRNSALSLKQKIDIIQAVANKTDKKSLAKRYSCALSTINRIVKNGEAYKKAAQSGSIHRKRQRKSVHEKVEDALCDWFNENKTQNATISNAVLLKKAKEFAVRLEDDFDPGLNWLFRWRKRNGIGLAKLNCERDDSFIDGSSVNSIPLLEMCKTEYVYSDENASRHEGSTAQEIQENYNEPTEYSAEEQSSQIITPVKVIADDSAPSINEALQSLQVVKRFCVLHDIEIGSLFSTEEKMLQHWKRSRSI